MYLGTGRLGRKQVEHCPQLRYQSQKDGLRSELFLVRFIQQQVSQLERDRLCGAQSTAWSPEITRMASLADQPSTHCIINCGAIRRSGSGM